jgi:hypothetical protein
LRYEFVVFLTLFISNFSPLALALSPLLDGFVTSTTPSILTSSPRILLSPRDSHGVSGISLGIGGIIGIIGGGLAA